MLQRDLAVKLAAEIADTHGRIMEAVSGLGGGRLNERPFADGWTIGDTLEHLCITTEKLIPAVQEELSASRRDAGAAAREWKPTLIGKLIANGLSNPKKLKSPKAFRPPASPRGGVVEAFRGLDLRMLEILEGATSADWTAVKVHSPAVPRWVPRYNLGDVFNVHSIHNARHLRQIERLLA